MDRNRDGVVTIDEFLECCRCDPAITNSMLVFDSTIWPPNEVPDTSDEPYPSPPESPLPIGSHARSQSEKSNATNTTNSNTNFYTITKNSYKNLSSSFDKSFGKNYFNSTNKKKSVQISASSSMKLRANGHDQRSKSLCFSHHEFYEMNALGASLPHNNDGHKVSHSLPQSPALVKVKTKLVSVYHVQDVWCWMGFAMEAFIFGVGARKVADNITHFISLMFMFK